MRYECAASMPSEETQMRRLAPETQQLNLSRLPGLKIVNDPMNNLQINLFEGPDSVIDFALPKKLNERLSLPLAPVTIQHASHAPPFLDPSHSSVPAHLPWNGELTL
jgi:hypothetical protein